MNNTQITQIALEQSANDCNCNPADFTAGENRFFPSSVSDKAKRYLELPHICNLVSYGSNIVTTAQAPLLPALRQVISHMPHIEHCFETPGIYAINNVLEKVHAKICIQSSYFLPDPDAICQFHESCTYELRVLQPEDFSPLYISTWSNALCADRKSLDRLAVGAYDKGRLVGLAGCSADSDTMWQIGVDVLPSYRRKGIGAILTNRLARETFDRGYVPFYCAAWSNVKSAKNAVRSGFRPGWVEAAAKSDLSVKQMLHET